MTDQKKQNTTGDEPQEASSMPLDNSTWDKQLPDEITDLEYPDLDKDLDLEALAEEQSSEDINVPTYLISESEENEIEASNDTRTHFDGLRNSEALDDKTHIRASDEQIAFNGTEISLESLQQDGVIRIDRDIDSQEMNSLDPGLERDDSDSGDDTTGRGVISGY